MKHLFLALLLLFTVLSCADQSADEWDKPVNHAFLKENMAWAFNWSKPMPAFKVIGNLYGVGTYDLGIFLVASESGHILINTGVEGSYHQIQDNMTALGLDIRDIKILLTMQAHWDHVAEFARIKAISNAEVWATAADAVLLEDGGFSDPLLGGEDGFLFRPVPVDKILQDGDVIEVGENRLVLHEQPGHTPGSASYSMVVSEGGTDYEVLIVNMATINPGTQLTNEPTYAGIKADFAKTFASQKQMHPDVWVASHAGFYGLHEKLTANPSYNPRRFYDPSGYPLAIAEFEKAFQEQLRSEQD